MPSKSSDWKEWTGCPRCKREFKAGGPHQPRDEREAGWLNDYGCIFCDLGGSDPRSLVGAEPLVSDPKLKKRLLKMVQSQTR